MAKRKNYWITDVDPKLWHRLKIMCAIQQMSIRKMLIKLIEDELDRFELFLEVKKK